MARLITREVAGDVKEEDKVVRESGTGTTTTSAKVGICVESPAMLAVLSLAVLLSGNVFVPIPDDDSE